MSSRTMADRHLDDLTALSEKERPEEAVHTVEPG
jgi:hypothetical protein